MKQLLCYISGPITADTPEQLRANIERAAVIARIVWESGHGCHCPHLNSSFPGSEKIPHAQYMRADLRILEACDCVIMMDTWGQSVGACIEHAHALAKRIDIVYADRDGGNITDMLALKKEGGE